MINTENDGNADALSAVGPSLACYSWRRNPAFITK